MQSGAHLLSARLRWLSWKLEAAAGYCYQRTDRSTATSDVTRARAEVWARRPSTSHRSSGRANRSRQSAALRDGDWGLRSGVAQPYRRLNFFDARALCTAPLARHATMKITNSAVPVYTISGSEARPLPEWLIRRRKRCAKMLESKPK